MSFRYLHHISINFLCSIACSSLGLAESLSETRDDKPVSPTNHIPRPLAEHATMSDAQSRLLESLVGVTTSQSAAAMQQLLISKSTISTLLSIAKTAATEPEIEDDLSDTLAIAVPRTSFADDEIFSDRRPHSNVLSSVPMLTVAHWQLLKQEISPIDHEHKDFYAGRPVSDICLDGAETGAPINTPAQISVWDMAIAESSQSALELASLELLQNPDGLSLLTNESASHRETDEDEQYQASWQQVLKQYLNASPAKRSIKDFMAYARKTNELSETDLRIIASIGELARISAEDCKRIGLNWQELVTTRKDLFSLGQCQKGDVREGPSIDHANLDNLTVDLTLSWTRGDLAIHLHHEEGAHWPISLTVTHQDKPIGAEYWFSSNGTMTGEWQFSKMTHEHFAWNDQGKLIWHGSVNQNSEWIEDSSWYSSGRPRHSYHFGNRGTVQKYSEWFENGKPAQSVSWQNNKIDGVRKWWHQNGKLAGEIAMLSGQRFGKGQLWFDSGVLGYSTSYTNDNIDGDMLWRTPSDKNLLTAKFRDGKADGTLTIKDEKGNIIAKSTFDYGRTEGVVDIRSGTNKSHAALSFKSAVLDGVVRLTDYLGVLRVEIPYRSGRISGDVATYSNSGKRLATCTFQDNRLMAWSFTPDDRDTIKLFGRVTRDVGGVATQTLEDTATGVKAECQSSDWLWRTCRWRDRKKQWPAMTSAMMINASKKQIPGNMFQPDRCNGVTIAWNLSPWMYNHKPEVLALLNVKGECKNPELLTSAICTISIAKAPGNITKCEAGPEEAEDNDEE